MNFNPLHSPAVDQTGVHERVSKFRKRSIKKSSKVDALKLALSMIDLTTLEGADTPGKVRQMSYKAMHPHLAYPGLPSTAAVCVYPTLVKIATEALKGSGVKVAAVATAFPAGQSPLSVKLEDTRFAVSNGADEIDMVIARGEYHRGNYSRVYDEIAAIKEACGNARLKVILETGELGSLDHVRRASDIAMHAGADFIKTSTGKIFPAATFSVSLVMLEAIRDFYYDTGKMIGMKPAGGIREAKTAITYLVMVKETLGQAWLTNEWFRFGSSSLINDLLRQIVKQETGVYQSFDYFSID